MAITYDPTTADVGTVEKIPSGDIIIDLNVRQDIRLDKSFVSSVRVYGFLMPPVGYRDEDGKVHITVGQRRVSAALEIGWSVIPILVKPKVEAEGDRAEELRILSQLAENEQRTGLTDAEIAAGYKQLALVGVSEDQIARKTNSAKARVATALKVAGSTVAVDAIEKHELTLDQAAILIEFEDDNKAVAELREVAAERPEQLEHRAQQIRSRVARERHGQSVADKARAEGWKVLYRDPNDYNGYGIPNGHARIEGLWRADDPKQTKLTLDDVKDHPARVVYIDTTGHREEARVEWLIKDHKKHGFASHYDSSGSTSGPLSDAEKAARRQKRTDKAEMTDATIVRRTWIKDTLLRTKLDVANVLPWIADSALGLTRALGYDQAAQGTARELACDLLGIGTENPDRHRDDRKLLDVALSEAGTSNERLRILLAYSIALVEHVAGHQRHHAYGQFTPLAPYFLQLQAWGYTLADVEQRIVDAAAAKKGDRK